jgi:hypothetical protein
MLEAARGPLAQLRADCLARRQAPPRAGVDRYPNRTTPAAVHIRCASPSRPGATSLSRPGATISAQSPLVGPHFRPIRAEANNSKQRMLRVPATTFVHATTGSLASNGPLALAASPSSRRPSGRPGQRRASDHHHPGSAAASRWRSRSTVTTRTRSRAQPSTAARPAASGPRPASCCVTGGPDGGPAMFVAEMPLAGTVSGGSVNPNPTTPVNLVS